jgi:lysozyme
MSKTTPRKSTPKRKSSKKSSFFKRNAGYIFGLLLIVFIAATAYHYRTGLAYYLGFKSHKISKMRKEVTEQEKRLIDIRNYQLLNKYEGNAVGFDVSQYQETIDWNLVRVAEDTFPLTFVFIRATLGKDKTDLQFNRNWFGSKRNKILRGAYHYYRPNENSIEQADNFIRNVKLEVGDLPPVLDIEKLPEEQSIDSLKVGLRRWLDKVEKHYGVKPIIYSGEKYYNTFLREEFAGYTFWIANYNFFVEDICDDWTIWQFTESASVKGIPCDVDLNIYNGTPEDLQELRIR